VTEPGAEWARLLARGMKEAKRMGLFKQGHRHKWGQWGPTDPPKAVNGWPLQQRTCETCGVTVSRTIDEKIK